MWSDADRSRRRRRVWAAAAGALVVVPAAVERTLRHLGAVPREVMAHLPGDDLVPAPRHVQTRAVDIATTPDRVWPWLVQIGWGRAGWYSLDLVERPLGAARSVAQDGTESWRSLDHVAPRHQDLAVGDMLPLRDGLGFTVVALDEPHHLVALLDVPVGDRRLRWSWSLVLRATATGTRLVARTRAASGGGPVGVVAGLALAAGHGVMETIQLRGIRRRAERTT